MVPQAVVSVGVELLEPAALDLVVEDAVQLDPRAVEVELELLALAPLAPLAQLEPGVDDLVVVNDPEGRARPALRPHVEERVASVDLHTDETLERLFELLVRQHA